MLPLSVCETFLGGPWLFDYYVICDERDYYKHQKQALAFASLPPSTNTNQGRDARKASTLVKHGG